jgi:hypothetical protein
MLWKENSKTWTIDPALGIHVNVEVCLLYRRYEWISELMNRKCRLDIKLLTRGDHQMGGLHLHRMKPVRNLNYQYEVADDQATIVSAFTPISLAVG